MIIVPKHALAIFTVACLAILVALGVLGFVLLAGAPKEAGETFVLAALVGFLVIVLGALLLTRASARRHRTAIRLFRRSSVVGAQATLAGNGGGAARAQDWEKALGEIGKHIVEYTSELVQLNEARALKINGMHSLLTFVTRNSPEVIGIINLDGVVVYGSADFHRIMEAAGKENTHKEPVLSRRELGHLVAELEKTNAAVPQKIGPLTYQTYAILDRRREIAYLACLLMDRGYQPVSEAPEVAEEPVVQPVTPTSFAGRIRRGVARFFGKNKG